MTPNCAILTHHFNSLIYACKLVQLKEDSQSIYLYSTVQYTILKKSITIYNNGITQSIYRVVNYCNHLHM